jgi:hypothetical protein
MRRLQTGMRMFAVALAIVPLPARAQSGVLSGMATDPDPDRGEREKVPAFRTVWIAHDAARARRLTTIPALVVPRRDGFWWLGLTNVCEGSEDECLGWLLSRQWRLCWAPQAYGRAFARHATREGGRIHAHCVRRWQLRTECAMNPPDRGRTCGAGCTAAYV